MNVSLENFGINDKLGRLQHNYPKGGYWIGFTYLFDEKVEIRHLGGFSHEDE